MPVDLAPERLPEDTDAERSLLATLCAPGAEPMAADIAFTLEEEDFVHPAHRAIFKALRALLQARLEVNALTLKDVLDQEGALSAVGGYPGLVELLSAEEVGRPQVLADLLRRKHRQRQLIRLGAQLARQAANEESPPESLVEQAAQDLFRLAQGDARAKGLEHIKSIADQAIEGLVDRIEGRGAPGLRVGFPRLDAITQGFQPGNLVILAARPGIGKTSLALNWLLRSALHQGAHTAFFSLEMSAEEVFMRLLSAHARVNMKSVLAGAFDATTEARLYASRDELISLPVFINDQASITVPQITAQIDRHLSAVNSKLDLVIIDYLQLLSSPEGSRAAKQSEAVRIGEISRGLKLLAKDRGLPVVVLSQLNREVEHRTGGRPQLSDLRDSGALEQDADIVAFIHRRSAQGQVDAEPERTAELIVAKHRNGPTGSIPLYFEGEYATYREMERVAESSY
jgi:replicative DNA helicase